nr:hypothetical protein [Lachnoclostridium sp. An181]
MMKEKLIRFMYGRYGVDQFSKFLVGAGIVCLILNLVSDGMLFYIAAFALLIYAYFRVFSKNHAKRYKENQKFLAMTAGIRGRISSFPKQMEQRKNYHIYKCPTCKQKIRIPRGKGKIEITCPKCHSKFIKRS